MPIERLLREYINEVLSGFSIHSPQWLFAPENLRYGEPTTGHTGGNVLSDEESDNTLADQNSNKCVACLIISEDGRVLAVSRKDDPNDFGLPGGHVEPSEELADAAARELSEETGMVAVKLTPVFSSADEQGHVTTTFMCEVDGEIDTDEEGVVRWVKPETLFVGSFGEYNKRLFEKLGLVGIN